MIPGFYQSTKKTMCVFNPKRRHQVEAWTGERISLSTYTVRGAAFSMTMKMISSGASAFLAKEIQSRALREQGQSDEGNGTRPKKSIRRQLWKHAAQASALLTTTLAASTSYGIEYAPKINLDTVGLLEIRDYTQTLFAAQLHINLAEPIDPTLLFAQGGLENAIGRVCDSAPKVWWYHFDRNKSDLNYLKRSERPKSERDGSSSSRPTTNRKTRNAETSSTSTTTTRSRSQGFTVKREVRDPCSRRKCTTTTTRSMGSRWRTSSRTAGWRERSFSHHLCRRHVAGNQGRI